MKRSKISVILPSVSKVSILDFVFCFFNTHIPEHFVLVLFVVISAVSRQHLHTVYLSPFFLDLILLKRNKMVTGDRLLASNTYQFK